MPTVKKKTSLKSARLSAAQIELVGQFNDYAYDNPGLSFDQVARKELGKNPFPRTPNGRQFRMECKEIFDRERKT
jgi:hypothetical protein